MLLKKIYRKKSSPRTLKVTFLLSISERTWPTFLPRGEMAPKS